MRGHTGAAGPTSGAQSTGLRVCDISVRQLYGKDGRGVTVDREAQNPKPILIPIPNSPRRDATCECRQNQIKRSKKWWRRRESSRGAKVQQAGALSPRPDDWRDGAALAAQRWRRRESNTDGADCPWSRNASTKSLFGMFSAPSLGCASQLGPT